MKGSIRITIRFFWHKIKGYKLLVSISLAALIVASISNLVWPIALGRFFELISSGRDKDTILSGLYSVLFVIIAIDAINILGWQICKYTNISFATKALRDIADEAFLYLQKHSYRFFNNNFTGALVKKFNRLGASFDSIVGILIFEFIPMAFEIIIITAVLFYLNFLLGAVLLVWVILFLVLNYFLALYKLKFDLERAAADTNLTAMLSDAITNSSTIKLFSALNHEMKRFKESSETKRRKMSKSWIISTHIDGFQMFLIIVLEVLILFISIKLWHKDLIGIGGLIIVQAYLLELFGKVWRFGHLVRRFYEQFADAEEMILLLNTPHEVVDKNDAKKLRVKSGKVSFENVCFSYGENDENVIKNLIFTVKSGQKVALVGPSGGGKTTIVKLILRLFDIQKGKITIDGQDISEVTQDSLRNSIALVPQDPILFHRSLFENIRYGRREASKKEVIAASKMAKCHEFIRKFPKGYDTFVGERGLKLSGGQRQRIAIARAILSNAKILILDEATSSLDSESEAKIQAALENLIKHKTTLIIAHRLSTVMKADRVFVLQNGKVVEEGQHGELISEKGGLYRKLWELQTQGYLATFN